MFYILEVWDKAELFEIVYIESNHINLNYVYFKWFLSIYFNDYKYKYKYICCINDSNKLDKFLDIKYNILSSDGHLLNTFDIWLNKIE